MDRVTPKNGTFPFILPETDSHREIDSKTTPQDLKELAITLFSKDKTYSSNHYAVLNALFDRPESDVVISLIQRVMHIFLEEREKFLVVQPSLHGERSSLSSYDKKKGDPVLSMIYAGALSTIQDFLDHKTTTLTFHNYTFELRMRSFAELNVRAPRLLKAARKHALQAFSEPALLLVRIQRLYIEVLDSGEAPFIIESSSLSKAASTEIQILEKDTKLPELGLIYDDLLAQELAEVLEEESKDGKKDDIVESAPVVSSNDMMFQFDDF